MKKTAIEELTIMEAVDAMSGMAELDPNELKENLLKVKKGEEPLRLHYWLDLRDPDKTVANIKHTFNTVYRYLEYFYKEDRASLQEAPTQRGIQAMMAIAKEAVVVMDSCSFALNDQKISALPEYQKLQNYYLGKIVTFIQERQEDSEWQEEWGTGPGQLGEIKRVGLKDLEIVKKDRDYELFFIRKEDGTAFFNRDLLRHLRLVTEFDESLVKVQQLDPLTKITLLHDKEMFASAKQIRGDITYDLNQFYKDAMSYRDLPLVADLNSACMALMLASNPRHLMGNTTAKPCVSYFADFQMYLRKILTSIDYIQLISNPIDPEDHLNQNILHLAHGLAYSFFNRLGHREEALSFIYGLLAKSDKKPTGSLWNQILDVHEEIYGLLKAFPNGPLFKALDVFQPGADYHGFDPIAQGNLPSKTYVVSFRNFHIDCLRLPTPTSQRYIQKAEITQEFKAFLRQLASHKRGDQHLIINLQDRTSWEEHARAHALEQAQGFAELSNNLVVMTLPKHTDFYHQSDMYLQTNSADDFISLILEQVKSGEECGFFFPKAFPLTKVVAFTNKALPLIHKLFFGTKNVLSRKNRLDFLEIFYNFLTLKIIEEIQPHSLSFTCKDAVDIGAAASAGFYAFLKLMSRSYDWREDEKDFLIWMLFGPALSVRERTIDLHRLSRTVSALSCVSAELEVGREKVLKACGTLYEFPLFKEVSVFKPN